MIAKKMSDETETYSIESYKRKYHPTDDKVEKLQFQDSSQNMQHPSKGQWTCPHSQNTNQEGLLSSLAYQMTSPNPHHQKKYRK